MMRSRWSWAALAFGVAAVWWGAGPGSAGEIPHRTSPRNTRSERKPIRFYILQVMGVSGQVTFETCGDIDLKERQRDYKEEYEKAVQDWAKSKAEAKKAKTEFKEDPPKGPKMMKKMEGSFKKEEDARAAAEKYQKQWDEAMEKKQAKKEGAGKEDTAKKEETKQE
jgi:hypothetical protein